MEEERAKWPNFPSSPYPSNSTSQTPSSESTTSSQLIECNHQPYDQISYTVRMLLMVPILIFGFAANTMNVIVFRHKRMRASMVNWYLVALSITDAGVLLSSFSMLSLPVICEDLDSLILFNFGVSAQKWTYALGLTMQTASVGMTVLVSAHRFLGVVYPFRAQQWCTTKRVKAAMWSVASFAVGFNIPRWFELTIDTCWSSVYNSTAIRLIESNLRLDNLYYNGYMVILYTLFMFAVPFLLLIIMNALIVRTVHRSYRLRQMLTNKISTNTLGNSNSAPSSLTPRQKLSVRQQQLLTPDAQQQTDRVHTVESGGVSSGSAVTTSNAKENKTTIMLIAVVFMFLLCNSLAFINNILEVLSKYGIPMMNAYLISVELSNFLVVVNSASNIFIYWTFSARYRLLCRRYVSCIFCCFAPVTSCTRSLRQRRRRRRKPNNETPKDGLLASTEAAVPRKPLLAIRKNTGYGQAGPCLDYVKTGVANTARPRHGGTGVVLTESTHRDCFPSKSKTPEPKTSTLGVIGLIRRQHSAKSPGHPPLNYGTSNVRTDPQKNRAPIVSSV